MTSSKNNPPESKSTKGFESLRGSCNAPEIETFGFEGDADIGHVVPPRPRKSAEACIVDAAFAAAMTADIRARADGGEILVAVVRVPSAAWVAPVEHRLNRFMGDGWFSIARDGSNRTRDKASMGNDDVTAMIAKHRSVAGIAPLVDILPSTLVAAADFTITIEQPDNRVLAAAIGEFLGAEVDAPSQPSPVGLDLPDLATACRSDSTSGEIFTRLGRASATRITTREDDVPALATAVEYGAAQKWALGAVADYKDYLVGRLPWSQVRSSAILYGPPGTRKTYLSRILAKELGVPLVATSIAELFTASSGYLDAVLRTLTEKFATTSDCVLFWDEIEILPSRMSFTGGRNDHYFSVVMGHFLTLMDGANTGPRPGRFLLSATNLIDRVDPALLRPGRFERSIEIKHPDADGVVSIVRSQLAGDLPGADISVLGQLAAGSTAAELMAFVQTARRSARLAERDMTITDLVDAIIPPSDLAAADLHRIAVHEAGHIVLALVCGGNDVVSAAVGGREGAHGHTVFRRAQFFENRAIVESHAATALGGRAAEIVLLGSCCGNGGGGEDSDLHKASSLIASLHFSEGLADHLAYLGPSTNVLAVAARDPSLRNVIEKHLRQLQDRAIGVVTDNREAVLAIADALAERRHLNGEEARRIFASATAAPRTNP